MKIRRVLVDYLGATLVLAVLPLLTLPLVAALVEAVEPDLSEGAAILLFIGLLAATWLTSGIVAGAALRIMGGWTPLQAFAIAVAASVTGGLIHTQGKWQGGLLALWALEFLGIGVGIAILGRIRAVLVHVDATPPRHGLAAAGRHCLYAVVVLLLPMASLVSIADDTPAAIARDWLAAGASTYLLRIIIGGLVAGLVAGLGLRRLGKWTISHAVGIAAVAGVVAIVVSSAGTGAALLVLLEVPLMLGAWLGAAAADHAQAFADSRAILTPQSDRADSQ